MHQPASMAIGENMTPVSTSNCCRRSHIQVIVKHADCSRVGGGSLCGRAGPSWKLDSADQAGQRYIVCILKDPLQRLHACQQGPAPHHCHTSLQYFMIQDWQRVTGSTSHALQCCRLGHLLWSNHPCELVSASLLGSRVARGVRSTAKAKTKEATCRLQCPLTAF